ncbi:hypothetical protein [Streptomyces lavendofoliae]|uniref:hypothetical protein n=1 Tax=Streptomyces lavendofoliae TaxID=67314 RepID=UPI003D93A737
MENVECCTRCAMHVERVAEAYVVPYQPEFFHKEAEVAYGHWKVSHPERGRQAAADTVVFRAEHGHGLSFRQLCKGRGWGFNRQVRGLVVGGLMADEWLTATGTVPWTLRPGPAAQARDIDLPKARSAPPAAVVTHI